MCDSVVLANGCLDHLLDGCGRKTTAAWGRTVDGEAPPGHTEPPPPRTCYTAGSCVRMRVSLYEYAVLGWRCKDGVSLVGLHRLSRCVKRYRMIFDPKLDSKGPGVSAAM